ncbi:MAG: TIGR00725 family protein [Deltaproteobacteria bacterium]|nr:TIGR00725 family protein [Deltaproteobacteria bacterium]
MVKKIHIGVIGAGECSKEIYGIAYEVGCLIGQNEWVLVCGGLGGVMEGAAKGCLEKGGITVGILPGTEKHSANPFVTLAIPTGMGEARNVLVVMASDVVIAVAAGYGTLSEIGLALKIGRPVVGLKTWPRITGIEYVETAQQAIDVAGRYVEGKKGY